MVTPSLCAHHTPSPLGAQATLKDLKAAEGSRWPGSNPGPAAHELCSLRQVTYPREFQYFIVWLLIPRAQVKLSLLVSMD